MKISLLLAATLASVTTAETSDYKPTGPSKSSKRGKNSKKGKYPFKDVVRSYSYVVLYALPHHYLLLMPNTYPFV